MTPEDIAELVGNTSVEELKKLPEGLNFNDQGRPLTDFTEDQIKKVLSLQDNKNNRDYFLLIAPLRIKKSESGV